MPASFAHDFGVDLVLAQDAVRSGVTVHRVSAQDKHWEWWVAYCDDHHLQPYIHQHPDPIPILQVFAHRYRVGRLAPSQRTVKSRTVEDALRAIAQRHTLLGFRDPRLNTFGQVDFRLSRQLRSYHRDDSPPIRVKPVPITLILHILQSAHTTPIIARSMVIADLITVAFYYLLRPGEYTGVGHADQPFLLQDVQLHNGDRCLDIASASISDITAATAASYTLTRQKNGIGNETLSHGRSNHPLCCPVQATIRLLLYHRAQRTPHHLPIASYYTTEIHRLVRVTALDVTSRLKAAATALQPVTGIPAAEISARSLRAGGAMALMCANIDCNVIQMLGRWHSDSMIRYLHVQAQPIINRLSARMFNDGHYTFLPTETVPTLPD